MSEASDLITTTQSLRALARLYERRAIDGCAAWIKIAGPIEQAADAAEEGADIETERAGMRLPLHA